MSPKLQLQRSVMPVIEIYTKPLCPYCIRAKRLFKQKGVEFTEIDIWLSSGRKKEMLERSEGRWTVPQIFIDGRGIGGSDDLMALDHDGELDRLLTGEPIAAPATGQTG